MIEKYQDLFDEIVRISREIQLDEVEEIIRTETIDIDVFFREGIAEKTLHHLFYEQTMDEYLRKHKIVFHEIGVWEDISGYERPLLYIFFGDEELEKTEISKMEERKQQGNLTVPLMIFSEDFFHIPYNEKLSYTENMDAAKDISEIPLIAFTESQIKEFHREFDEFLWCTSYYFKIVRCEDLCRNVSKELVEVINGIDMEFPKMDALQKKQVCIYMSAFRDILLRLDVLERKLKDIKNVIPKDYIEIQGRNLQEALRKRDYFTGQAFSSSDLGGQILLEYGHIIRLIKGFMDDFENRFRDDDFAMERIEDTKKLLGKACDVTLIGVFSSGKTTFINSVLGGQHNFRTSAKHNTAVLVTVKKCTGGNEKYKVKYKTEIENELVIPADDDTRARLYKSEHSAKVLDVDHDQRVLSLELLDTGEKKKLYIDGDNKIIVAKGAILKRGTRLTEGKRAEAEAAKVKCVSKEEIAFLYSLFDDIHAKNISIIINDGEKNSTQILQGEKAKQILCHLQSKLSIPDRHEKSEDIFDSRAIPELKGAHRITFKCDYQRDDEEVVLDDRGWTEFCDSKDSEVFMEKPECYVLAEALEVEMNSSFLEYCNIIDTPGFGSTTEKHDAISERCLREQKDILLVMVRVDNRPEKRSFETLLNKISTIYDADRSLDKEKVYFILNCYSDTASDESLKKSCQNMVKDITKRGFSEKKIYACNLKKSLESGQYQDKLYQMPSYKEFIGALKSYIEKEGLLDHFRKISTSIWEPYLDNEIEKTTGQLNEYKAQDVDREKNYRRKSEQLEKIKKVEMKKYEVIEQDIKDEIQQLIDMIMVIDSPKNWREEKKEICDYIDYLAYSFNQEDDDFIMNAFQAAISEICRFTGDNFESVSKLKEKPQFVFTSGRLKDLYQKTADKLWLRLWIKLDSYKEDMIDEIRQERKRSLDDYKQCYDEAESKFLSFKKKAIIDLETQMKNLSSAETLEQSIQDGREKLEHLKIAKINWNDVAHKIQAEG